MTSLKRLRELAGIEEQHTPLPLKKCVAAVAPKHGGDTSRAFAICTASMQRAGIVKPGTKKLTSKGKGKASAHAKDPGVAGKVASYEKLLSASRLKRAHHEATLGCQRTLAGIPETSQPKDTQPTVADDFYAKMRLLFGI